MPDRYKYIAQLAVLSTTLHAVLFFVVLFIGQMNHRQRFNIVINSNIHNAKIVFVPTLKTVRGSVASLAKTLNKQPSKKSAQVRSEKKVPIKKTVAPKKLEPPKSKMNSSKTTLATNTKPQQKKVTQNSEKKQESKMHQKSELKKEVSTTKQNEQKKVEKPSLEKRADKLQETIYIGRDDKAVLAMHNYIQEEIAKVWHPPVGLSNDLMCSIKVHIDKKGSILNLALEESSQVISYDIAARTALDKISFPKSLWGKEVVITFKQ